MSAGTEVSMYDRITIMAEGLVPVVRALEQELGEERAHELVAEALKPVGRSWGDGINALDGDGVMEQMVGGFAGFAADDALEYDVLRREKDALDVDVTGCRYSRFMKEIGAEDLGPLLICNLDYAMADAMNVTLERATTLMKGNDCCRFRFQTKG